MGQVKSITPGEIVSKLKRELSISRRTSLIVAISGIDGSGKTSLAASIHDNLHNSGYKSILVNLDDWHHPEEVRFSKDNWAENYYEKAYRFDEFFNRLITPLKYNRAVRLSLNLLDPNNNLFNNRVFNISDVDIVIMEGVFLLKSIYRKIYDLAYWIECPYDVALNRVLQRNQEGLPEDQLLFIYNHIFFPAQQLHILRDEPLLIADAVVRSNQE